MKKIKSIEIKNSPFYKSGFKIEFDDKLNCIMGGRGTGKTTLLYFIMATLNKDTEETNKIAYNILKNNLGKGEIILEIENSEGISYKISKFFNDEPQPSKLPGGDFISISKIFSEIECDIYEASEIEEIGKNSEERLKLINKTIPESITDLMVDVEKFKIELNDNAQNLLSVFHKLDQKKDALSLLANSKVDLEEYRKNQPKDIDPKEDEEFNKADNDEKLRKSEKRYLNKTNELYTRIKSDIVNLNEDLEDFIQNNTIDEDKLLNKDLMKEVIKGTHKTIEGLSAYFKQVVNKIDMAAIGLNEIEEKLTLCHENQQSEFIKLKQKIQTHKEYYSKLNELTVRDHNRNEIEKDYNEEFKKLEKLKITREKILINYNRKKQEIFNIRAEKISELNKLFEGQIRISLEYGGIINEYESQLKEALRGSGLRYNELVPKISQKYSPDKFTKIVNNGEVKNLSVVLGIEESRAKLIIDKLSNTAELFEIESIYCPDLPDFFLRIEKGSELDVENFQKSDYLSTGQRCTTVLPIVFAVSQNPLIIDQPEDNLDNKYITHSIYKIIKQQKVKRQLVFITHNPNIPVLSEAEKNIFLKFDLGSSIEKEGTVEEVKNNILELLEGGKEAFDTRQKLYDNEEIA